MRVALYARVSTDRQAEKYGISSQMVSLSKRCQERQWVFVFDGEKDAFIDDGYSGADLDRPALNRLHQAVREGRADIAMAYDPDRLSRRLFHLMILADEFEKQLSIRTLTNRQEENIRKMVARVGKNLSELDFNGR